MAGSLWTMSLPLPLAVKVNNVTGALGIAKKLNRMMAVANANRAEYPVRKRTLMGSDFDRKIT